MFMLYIRSTITAINTRSSRIELNESERDDNNLTIYFILYKFRYNTYLQT